VPLETFTLEKLAEQVLKKELNMANPELSLESGPWHALGHLMLIDFKRLELGPQFLLTVCFFLVSKRKTDSVGPRR
jgi:hypothetical protein